MILKVEAATVFNVQARCTFCHNTVPKSTALSAIMVHHLQTGKKNNLVPTV
jgi:hypothetical protein